MDPPPPTYCWTVTAEPWAEALVALAPGLQAFLYPTVGLVFPDGCPLTFEQVRDHPEVCQFRVRNELGHVTKVGMMVGKDSALAEFLDELCRGSPSEVEFFEDGVWNFIQYGTPSDD